MGWATFWAIFQTLIWSPCLAITFRDLLLERVQIAAYQTANSQCYKILPG
jgi:hypothetical protein